MYKKATSLPMYFDSSTKAKIFKAMTLPCITYNCITYNFTYKPERGSNAKTETADHRSISRENNWKKANLNLK